MIGLQSGFVTVVEYQADWSHEYAIEKERLNELIGKYVLDIQHVGSTSIENCYAKPVIDIAVAITSLEETDKIIQILKNNAYEYHGDAGIPGRHFFTKGKKENRTHYIHIEEQGGKLWNNHILFRDYLIHHTEYVTEYNALKIRLAKQYSKDRTQYAEGKNKFIEDVIAKAIEENVVR